MNLFYMIRNRNFWAMVMGDVLFLMFAYYLAYYLRFDGMIPLNELNNFALTVTWMIPLKILIIFYYDLYKGMWRYTSIYDLLSLIKASVISSGIIMTVILIMFRFGGFSRGVFVIDFMLTLLFLSGYRLSVRLFYTQAFENKRSLLTGKNRCSVKRILIIGAGSMGEKLVRGIAENPKLHYDVVGFIDDDPYKLNHKIHGIPVLGVLQDMEELIKQYGVEEIIIAISSASAIEMRRIINSCKTVDIPFKTIPGMGELIEGRINLNTIRDVRYEDLLGREPVQLDMKQICGYLAGKRVMVTGGAGSIGSELCRQISRFKPDQLILVEQNESGLYDIELSLRAKFPDLKTVAILASIQDERLLQQVFEKTQPHVVFHAAAYKHVPMMELHPWEAVFNNVIGTRNVLELCHQHKIERFVLVSTDKSVRSTNVMGVSKRVAEIMTQAYSKKNHTRYMVVRFGNVIGSVGSVIPLFKKQIERGGPVTVTHPDVTRYFMTIPEACRLILQAGAIGEGGEIFVLKMGVPVKIADMAKDMIRLSGFEPGKDIEIEYTGLDPVKSCMKS